MNGILGDVRWCCGLPRLRQILVSNVKTILGRQRAIGAAARLDFGGVNKASTRCWIGRGRKIFEHADKLSLIARLILF